MMDGPDQLAAALEAYIRRPDGGELLLLRPMHSAAYGGRSTNSARSHCSPLAERLRSRIRIRIRAESAPRPTMTEPCAAPGSPHGLAERTARAGASSTLN
jgi:hypothetical protein